MGIHCLMHEEKQYHRVAQACKNIHIESVYKHNKKQGNCWKRGMLPKCLLSIKGRSCNQTPFVHQDMTMHFLLLTYMYVPSFISIPFILSKIRHRQESIINQINDYGEITLSIYRIGLCFLCTALPLTVIYL